MGGVGRIDDPQLSHRHRQEGSDGCVGGQGGCGGDAGVALGCDCDVGGLLETIPFVLIGLSCLDVETKFFSHHMLNWDG
jgi:hypothetical protein